MATRENTRRKGEERAEWVKSSSVLSCLHFVCCLECQKYIQVCVFIHYLSFLNMKVACKLINYEFCVFFFKLKIEKCLTICIRTQNLKFKTVRMIWIE